jgi:hypothetical protein
MPRRSTRSLNLKKIGKAPRVYTQSQPRLIWNNPVPWKKLKVHHRRARKQASLEIHPPPYGGSLLWEKPSAGCRRFYIHPTSRIKCGMNLPGRNIRSLSCRYPSYKIQKKRPVRVCRLRLPNKDPYKTKNTQGKGRKIPIDLFRIHMTLILVIYRVASNRLFNSSPLLRLKWKTMMPNTEKKLSSLNPNRLAQVGSPDHQERDRKMGAVLAAKV